MQSPFIDSDVLLQSVGIVTVSPEVEAGLRFGRSTRKTRYHLERGSSVIAHGFTADSGDLPLRSRCPDATWVSLSFSIVTAPLTSTYL